MEQALDLTSELPETVTCELRSQVWVTEVDDYFHLRLRFPSGLLVTLEGSNSASIPLPRWFVVGRSGTLAAAGAWGEWTAMRVRGVIAEIPMDLVPQALGPSSGSRDYDVGGDLSACFYDDMAEAFSLGRPEAVTTEHACEVMEVLQAARRSAATGETTRVGH